MLGLRANVAGLVPSLPTVILPLYEDCPHSCHFRCRAYWGKEKRKVWWERPCRVECTAQHPVTLSTSLSHMLGSSALPGASHLSGAGAESWGPDKRALGTSLSYHQSHLFSVSYWRLLLAHPCLLSSQRRLWRPLGLCRQTFLQGSQPLAKWGPWPQLFLPLSPLFL